MTTMSLERFSRILDAYGAAAHRWPPEARAEAIALVEASPEARAMLERAAEVDRLLDAAPAMAPSGALRQAVLRSAPSARAGRRVAGWQVAAALAASLALGMVAGGAIGVEEPAEATADVLQLALFHDDRVGY